MPTAPEHFRGIVPLRGHIVTVVDLEQVLGIEKTTQRGADAESSRRLLAVMVNAVPFAVEVDAVVALHEVPSDGPGRGGTLPARALRFRDQELGKGHFSFGEETVTWLDLEALLRGLEKTEG